MYPLKKEIEQNPLFYTLGGGVINKAYEVKEKQSEENDESNNAAEKKSDNDHASNPFGEKNIDIQARYSGDDDFDDDEDEDSDEVPEEDSPEEDSAEDESEEDSDEKKEKEDGPREDDDDDDYDDDYDANYYDYDDDYDSKKRSNRNSKIKPLKDDEIDFGEKINYNKPIEDDARLATFNDDIRTSPLSISTLSSSGADKESNKGVKKVFHHHISMHLSFSTIAQ